jgi:NADH-quinone oxidoreductase subunit L
MSGLLLGVVASFIAAALALALGQRGRRLVATVGVAGAGLATLGSCVVVAQNLLGTLGTQTLTLAQVPTGGLAFHLAFRADGLSAMVSLLVASVALAVQVYSVTYMRAAPRYPSYVALVSLFTSAMLLVVAADDLFVLLVGWEVMGLCSYLLISHHWELAAARDAAVKAFLVTRLGDIGFLFGIFVLGTAADSFRISEIQHVAGDLTTGAATLATLLLLCGVVGKSAQFPLHVWLPDAMAGPTPVSALIHAATMVAAGVFVVARLLDVFQAAPATLVVLALIAAVTMVGSALAAFAEDDVKRILAWSTVSQLAVMFAGLAAGGYAAAVLLLVVHGAFKALLFLSSGTLTNVAGGNDLAAMGGLRSRLPVTFVTMTVGLAALAALPPLAGFFAKDAVLGAVQEVALHGGALPRGAAWPLLLAGLATVVLTAAYCTRLWLRVFFGPSSTGEHSPTSQPSPTSEHAPSLPGGAHDAEASAEVSAFMRWPVIGLAVPSVLLGLVALAPMTWSGWLGGGPADADDRSLLHVSTTLVSTLLVVGSIAAVVWFWREHGQRDPAELLGRARPLIRSGFRLDDLIGVLVVRPVWTLSRAAIAGDRDVVDVYVSGAGRLARLLGGALRLAQTGNVQTYLSLLLAGVVVLAVAAWGAIT